MNPFDFSALGNYVYIRRVEYNISAYRRMLGVHCASDKDAADNYHQAHGIINDQYDIYLNLPFFEE